MTRSNPSVGSGSTTVGAAIGVNALASTSVSWRRSTSSSAPHDVSTRRACGSSVMASNRCSSPTSSCRRSEAMRKARWMVSSVSGANGTGVLLMFWSCVRLHGYEQGKFLFLCHLPSLSELRLGDVVRVNAGNADARQVHVQHDLDRLWARLAEHRLEHPHDELLRRVVIVVQQHTPHPWAFQLLI